MNGALSCSSYRFPLLAVVGDRNSASSITTQRIAAIFLGTKHPAQLFGSDHVSECWSESSGTILVHLHRGRPFQSAAQATWMDDNPLVIISGATASLKKTHFTIRLQSGARRIPCPARYRWRLLSIGPRDQLRKVVVVRRRIEIAPRSTSALWD
jgi:hypothetical protein